MFILYISCQWRTPSVYVGFPIKYSIIIFFFFLFFLFICYFLFICLFVVVAVFCKIHALIIEKIHIHLI